MNKLITNVIAALFLVGTLSAAEGPYYAGSSDPLDYADCCESDSFSLSGNVYGYVDWLFWKGRRCGLEYAFAPASFSLPLLNGSYHDVHPDYDSGFRVALGYTTCQGYDLGFRYTRFSTDAHDHLSSLVPEIIPLRLVTPSFNTLFLEADAKYSLDYNLIDIELGSYAIRECETALKLFMGARIAVIDEEINTSYLLVPSENPLIISAHETLDLTAYGLSVGFEYERELLCNFGLFVRGSGALLVGDYESKHQEFNEQVEVQLNNLKAHNTCLLSELEIALGLDYLVYQCCETTVRLGIGYEFQGWFNTRDFLNLNSQPFTTDGVAEDSLLLPFLSARNQGTFGVDGLFVRLAGSF